ncbi:MAG: histidine kinase [Flavobacteriaceae bacterium]|jgi:signal transduction histidine kinase|nr:histidine kinase [Flavobacteriaceae bacterium]
MKNKLPLYSFVLLILLTLTHCTGNIIKPTTDIDQLYAVQHNMTYKDSLAKKLHAKVSQGLTLSNTPINRATIDSILKELRWTADSINFRKLSQKSIRYAQNRNDLNALANTYNNIGMYYHDILKLDSTFYYYIKTENVYKELHDSIKIAETRFYQARLLFEMGLHMESETKVSQSLMLLQEQPYNPVNFEANQLMGLCLMERKNFKDAESYLRKAVNQILKDISTYKILDSKRAKMAIGNAYGNLAEVCYNQNKFQEAKSLVIEGQKYLEADTPIMLVSFLRNTLAQANYRLTKDHQYINEVIQSYADDSILGNAFRMHYTAMDLAHLYLLENKTLIANSWAQKAYNNATKNNVIPQQVEALEFLLSNDDYEMRDQVKQLIKLRETLTAQDNETRNVFARIAYETETIQQEKNRLNDLIYIISLIGISLVLILIISITRFKLKAKNKELLLVNSQRMANENINELIVERNMIALDIREKERKRIAKDLHDGVVNSIFTIRFNLQLMTPENMQTRDLLLQELEELETKTRNISHDLIDNVFFHENKFIQLIEDQISMQVNPWKTKFYIECDKAIDFKYLDATTKVNLYYIIREAIQNVNKYSKAIHCHIKFILVKDNIELIIQDNGIGFEKTNDRGIGINNMKERTQSINGKFSIHSKQNIGTIIRLNIPYLKNKNNII